VAEVLAIPVGPSSAAIQINDVSEKTLGPGSESRAPTGFERESIHVEIIGLLQRRRRDFSVVGRAHKSFPRGVVCGETVLQRSSPAALLRSYSKTSNRRRCLSGRVAQVIGHPHRAI